MKQIPWHSENEVFQDVHTVTAEIPPCNEFVMCQVKITGDHVDFGEVALIICNHRTRVDWMFLWVLCLRQGQLSGLKIVLKESLKGVPGFGWATQVNDRYSICLCIISVFFVLGKYFLRRH